MAPPLQIESFPGYELVRPGLADLRAGRETVEACAVAMAASRLSSAGVPVPEWDADEPAAHRLYRLVAATEGDGAHSRYNAILGRIVGFVRAAERARAG